MGGRRQWRGWGWLRGDGDCLYTLAPFSFAGIFLINCSACADSLFFLAIDTSSPAAFHPASKEGTDR